MWSPPVSWALLHWRMSPVSTLEGQHVPDRGFRWCSPELQKQYLWSSGIDDSCGGRQASWISLTAPWMICFCCRAIWRFFSLSWKFNSLNGPCSTMSIRNTIFLECLTLFWSAGFLSAFQEMAWRTLEYFFFSLGWVPEGGWCLLTSPWGIPISLWYCRLLFISASLSISSNLHSVSVISISYRFNNVNFFDFFLIHVIRVNVLVFGLFFGSTICLPFCYLSSEG